MATRAFYKTALTGGGSTALDSIVQSLISDGDFAWVFSGGTAYLYAYNASGTDAESSPDIIRPDDYATSGVWVLQQSPYDSISTMPSGVSVQGGITGLDCSADTDSDHDVSVAIGECRDSTNTSSLKLSTSMVKRIDGAWSAGTGNGGMLTGVLAANTVYHFYALLKSADNSVDFGWLADGLAIGTYLPSGYAKYRWLRFYKTDSSSNLCQTTQSGDYILHHKASDWVLSSSITSSYAAITHSAFVPTSKIELIEYGCRDATAAADDDTYIYASEDGTNTSFSVASPAATTSDTSPQIWGSHGRTKSGLYPFNTNRQFRTTSGTLDLLIHSVKLKR